MKYLSGSYAANGTACGMAVFLEQSSQWYQLLLLFVVYLTLADPL